MRSLRTLAALALTLLGLTVAVPSASATDPFPVDGVVTLTDGDFTVHYNGDDTNTNCANAVTEEKAGDVLGMLERARTFYAGMGWPVPAPGVNVSIDDFAADGTCAPFGNGLPFGVTTPLDRWDAFVESGNIHLDAHSGLTYPVIAHEVFHLVEDTMVPGVDPWLQEGTAEWAAVRATKAAGGDELNPDRALDCVGSRCGDAEYDKNGYAGWILFEYLAERYGDADVKAVWDQAVANPGAPGTTDLANVLPAATSLASFFNAYTTARMTGSFTISSLTGTRPAAYAGISVPTTSGAVPDTPVAVNHLAVRYVTFAHGSDPTALCFAATLTLNVAVPAGVASTPTYYANTTGSSPQPLTLSGSNASITVPWNTCAGSPLAYLSLPNDSLGADGREFTVTGSVTVDASTPAAPTGPPPGVHVIGTPVPAPTSDPAPTLNVYAPEVIKVSSRTRLLRFVVFSSGDGKLGAVLGATGLGSAALRSGNNDVRFVLPTRLFQSLRTKAVSNILQLTSMSPAGTKGATFTRHVVVQKPAKKKPAKQKH
jgi:hypothetical protein